MRTEDMYYNEQKRSEVMEAARRLRRKFLRYQQAETVYSLSHKKLMELANAADSVLISVQPVYLPVKGLQQLIKTILMVKKRLNRGLEIQGILLTMVDYRTNYAKDITAKLQFTVAVDIFYIDKEMQEWICEYIKDNL